MRASPLIGLALLAIACSPGVERTAGLRTPTRPSASLNDPAGVDTGQGRLPDLIVDASATARQWVVRDENLPASYCSVEEGHVTPGVRRILRMTVETPNIGTADNFIGNPLDHMGPMAPDGTYPQSDGLFEFAECHNHFHFKYYALYELVDAHTNQVWRAAKRGFCMLDTDPQPTVDGIEPPGPKNYLSCGSRTSPGFQGISHGWIDTYRFFLGGQYFVLDGGDGQAVVPPGDYYIRVTVNPPYAPDKKGNCPRVKDPATKLCHQFAELRYDNNVGAVLITVPAHPGKSGVGTAVNDPSPGNGGAEPVDGQ